MDEEPWRGRAVRIRVVDSVSRQGVPHAPIWFARPGSVPRMWLSAERAEAVRNLYDRGWRYRGQGVKVTADEEGYAAWSVELGPEVVAFSERGTWRGLVSFQVGEDAADLVELELIPDTTIHVHAIDGLGTEVEGADIDWRIWDSEALEEKEPRWQHSQTWDSGLVLRHLGMAHEGLSDAWRVQARARVPGTGWSESPILAIHPGELHIELNVTALARLDVRVQDPHGVPLRYAPEAYLHLSEGTKPRKNQLWSFMTAGEASFPVVPGRRYTVRLGSRFPSECRWQIDAPVTAGTREEHILTVGSHLPIVSLRMVDERGRPMGENKFSLRLAGHDASHSVLFETDADGRGQFILPAEWTGDDVDRAVITRFAGRDGRMANLLQYGRLRAGVQDFGDIRFAEGDLVIAGEVVRETLATSENTRLSVWRSEDGKREWTPVPLGVSWQGGRFEVRGFTRPGEHRIRASTIRGSLRPSPWMHFRPGETEARLRMAPGAALEVPVRGLRGKGMGRIWVRALPLEGEATTADGDEQGRWRESGPNRGSEDGAELQSLWISRLPTGRYRIELYCSGLPEPLFHEEVQVLDPTGPMHLSPVVLEERVQPVRVRVLTSHGQAAEKGFLRVEGTGGSAFAPPIRDGLAELWLDRPRAVEVRVEGYSPLTVPDVFDDIVVSVEKE